MQRGRIDNLGMQETVRQDFSDSELRSLECGGQYCWNWLPASGQTRGMLLGFRDECFEVGTWRKGRFFISADLFHRSRRVKWTCILVYGPADHSRTREFLEELSSEVESCRFPLVVGGDFNLIRGLGDKSYDNINWPRVRQFNDAIASLSLRELNRTGARFTWTNKQLSPICSALDRVFVSTSWETLFPLCSLTAVTRVGSDHNPLLLDDVHCEMPSPTPPRVGANLGRQTREARDNLLSHIKELDTLADSSGLDEEGSALRYFLEDQIVQLDGVEEDYWRQRSRLQWTLKGDSCTAFFHAFANGRRRNCLIPRLVNDDGEISDQVEMMGHVYQFYHGLCAEGEERAFSLAQDLWPSDKRISDEENRGLELTFTPDELDEVLAGMKPDSAPGPDGLPVLFFKKFWDILRGPILRILNDFALGRVDIARLNFGVISLIPKVQGADTIKQFRPTTLINIIFKFVAKAYATRLTPLAHRTIDRSQSAFIKGRYRSVARPASHRRARVFAGRRRRDQGQPQSGSLPAVLPVLLAGGFLTATRSARPVGQSSTSTASPSTSEMAEGTPVMYEDLTEELKKKHDEVKAILEADLIGSFQRTRSHGIRWKGFSPEGALDGVDLSAPSEERTRSLRQEINFMVAHSLHRHSESLVNTLERVASGDPGNHEASVLSVRTSSRDSPRRDATPVPTAAAIRVGSTRSVEFTGIRRLQDRW
ncbi:hypothetical protein QYE76_047722 [Lolium multiflorum]|uniref:Endonuclease/exonuclease/phosphatase domain-containing protein n=1 Tax=Lolium multiflorum TaxID=4521 RepID=A0AAD8TPB5_LOLMU|nr:hypothetical protein QYE76_047722 [Lolium multiflorum]